MPLLKDGAEIENLWLFVDQDDEAELKPDQAVTLPLARFLEQADSLAGRNAPVGVRLVPEDDAELLVPFLEWIQLVEISFPKYTDGRGYSQAQLLRRRHGFAGELRAVGHVLRDQIFYMNRSGFDAYETARADLPSVLEALNEFRDAYQPAADGRVSVFHARHGS